MNQLRIVSLILYSLFASITFAQSGYVGESIYLSGPTVPGTIGAAAWTSDNSAISVTGDSHGATVQILSYFSGTATVTCHYSYSYVSGGKVHYSGPQQMYDHITCKPSTLILDKRDITLKVGQETTLTYTNSSGIDLPWGAYWTTSDEKVVGLWDDYGYWTDHVSGKTVTIRAVEVGECTITCSGSTGNPDPTCKVTVIANPPTAIEMNPNQLTLQGGGTKLLSYKLTPSDAHAKVTWASSNESIAKVSSTGRVTAVSEGTATITVTTDNGLSASAVVEVVPLPRQVSLSNGDVTVGYQLTLKPVLTPGNAITTYKWEIQDPKIASIDEAGRVKGKTAGSTMVTVTTENEKTAQCRITVKNPSQGMDSRNAQIRIQTLQELVKKSLDNIK